MDHFNSFKNKSDKIFMGKNSHLHFTMETSLKEFLKKEAAKNSMYMAEYCRTIVLEEQPYNQLNQPAKYFF